MIALEDMTPAALEDSKTLAHIVALDPKNEEVTWDIDTSFFALLTSIDNTQVYEPGGSIQQFSMTMVVPRLLPVPDGTYSEQLTDGVPGEGDVVNVRGVDRRIISVAEGQWDEGWTFVLAGPDEGK